MNLRSRKPIFWIFLGMMLIGLAAPHVVLAQATGAASGASSSTSSSSSTTSSKKKKATASTAPASTSAATPAAPATANKPAGASTAAASTGKTASTVQAQTPPSPGMVWVNTSTKVYHKAGSTYYGKTKQGKWMAEQDAVKAGYKAASN